MLRSGQTEQQEPLTGIRGNDIRFSLSSRDNTPLKSCIFIASTLLSIHACSTMCGFIHSVQDILNAFKCKTAGNYSFHPFLIQSILLRWSLPSPAYILEKFRFDDLVCLEACRKSIAQLVAGVRGFIHGWLLNCKVVTGIRTVPHWC